MSTKRASDSNREIAKTVAAAFGGSPKVTRYWDDARKSCVDVLLAVDRPQAGVGSYSTLGLSDHPLMKDGVEYGARVELVGVCGSEFRHFDNIIATTALFVINDGWFCCPGAVFPDVVSMYRASKTLKHVLFAPPFLWDGRLRTLTLTDKTVAWLLVVPISDAERTFVESKGLDALDEVYEASQIDIFDLNRPSVL